MSLISQTGNLFIFHTLMLQYLHFNLTKYTKIFLPVTPSYHSYLRAAVWSSGAAVEVILGQKKGGVGHVQYGVVHQHHLTEVKLVGETLSFGFV